MEQKDRRPRTKPPGDTWFVYLLRCADGSLYTGISKEVSRRCEQHNAGTASRYTRSRLPVSLVYQEAHASRSLALSREAAIKALSRQQKEAQIRRVGEDEPAVGQGEAPVSKQNRVTPFGEIVATPHRGTFLGNRGVLHDAEGGIKRPWQGKRWIVCVLEFRGRRRTVMTPGHYTELFFLDEAIALAAGHRPCSECRHDRFLAFGNAWKKAHPRSSGSQRPTATEIDNCLHAERVAPDGSKRSSTGALNAIPDGVLVTLEGWGERAYLVWGDSLFAWSPEGYRGRRPRPKGKGVRVLTPPSTVAAIRAGYVPEVHASARR